MIRTSLVALLAAAPALTLAQVGALNAARGARDTTDRANAAIGAAADAASAPEAPVEAKRAPAAPRPVDTSVELDDSGTVALPEGSATVADEGRAELAPPERYTVRRGDTLWDLSGRFLSSPWYWPKLWSYNPQITNPHWIAPGQVVRIVPGADGAAAQLEPVEEDAPAAIDGETPEAVDDDLVAVSGPYKIGYVAPRTMLVRHDTFVTRREVAESGRLTASFEEKAMLAQLDQAYARFGGAAPVKIGETYVLYKTEREIHHPASHELLGYQSTVLGAARVVKVDDQVATLVITQSFEPIERGALLGPWTERFVRPVARKPNTRRLDGRIVAAQVDVVTEIGEHHVVFIDKGSDDGVQEGNLFHVIRRGDAYDKPVDRPIWDPSMPKEVIGDLLVVDVKPNASAALVTRSVNELAIGDHVEMTPDAGAAR